MNISISRAALLERGLHPAAFDALQKIHLDLHRVGQCIGDAKASAGTHATDGTANGLPYGCAFDLRVRNPVPLSASQTRDLLGNLAEVGIAAFYRLPGSDHWPAGEAVHIHAIFCAAAMKKALRDQVHDWCNGRNGLKSHAPYTFWQPTQTQENIVRAAFLAHNPANG